MERDIYGKRLLDKAHRISMLERQWAGSIDLRTDNWTLQCDAPSYEVDCSDEGRRPALYPRYAILGYAESPTILIRISPPGGRPSHVQFLVAARLRFLGDYRFYERHGPKHNFSHRISINWTEFHIGETTGRKLVRNELEAMPQQVNAAEHSLRGFIIRLVGPADVDLPFLVHVVNARNFARMNRK
ncbi:hypothetical protein EVAR_30931_1 [Eumeta japonica]|uniref:Uncharacterized protein n=1 Tax=Eumeta variegata TaxID=151549 RepID=A0A4C1V3I4_EUMVA|nr:hypothetical protein EVAR_30931_1 [Eumeta japonica]